MASAVLLTACSENHTPAVIERKGPVYNGNGIANKAPEPTNNDVFKNHGSIQSGSDVSETPLVDSNRDAYQEELPAKAEVDHSAESFDLDGIQSDDKLEESHVIGAYKTATPLADKNFIWPVDGEVISHFGKTSSGVNEGLTIAIPTGTPIKASANGKAIFVGHDKLYGNLVIIQHPNEIYTAYAHNSSIAISQGQSVIKGDVIATSGSSGEATSPQLYFSIRKNSITIDPEKAL